MTQLDPLEVLRLRTEALRVAAVAMGSSADVRSAEPAFWDGAAHMADAVLDLVEELTKTTTIQPTVGDVMRGQVRPPHSRPPKI